MKVSFFILFTLSSFLCLQAQDWKKLEYKELGFRIELPSKSPYTRDFVENGDYGKIKMNLIMVVDVFDKVKPGFIVTNAKILNSNISKDKLKATFDEMISNIKKTLGGKIQFKKNIRLQGRKGVELKFSLPNTDKIINLRAYLNKQSVIMLQVSGKDNKEVNKQKNRFYKSLKFI